MSGHLPELWQIHDTVHTVSSMRIAIRLCLGKAVIQVFGLLCRIVTSCSSELPAGAARRLFLPHKHRRVLPLAIKTSSLNRSVKSENRGGSCSCNLVQGIHIHAVHSSAC